jgi:hypothetical protein
MVIKVKLINCGEKQSYLRVAFFELRGLAGCCSHSRRLLQFTDRAVRCEIEAPALVMVYELSTWMKKGN